jgi:hypothetical protein
LAVLTAVRAPRRATIAAAAVALLGVVGIISGFGDGTYFKHGLTPADHGLQTLLTMLTGALVVIALNQIARTRRPQALTA